jgi:sulfate-transporting ATPase
MAQYVMSMLRVSKMVPPKRQIIKDISLSVLPRRQDRRAGLERFGQIHAAAHHGGYRQRYSRRGAPAAGHQDRLPAAGTAVESRQKCARQCRGRRAGSHRCTRRAGKGVRRLRRTRRRFRCPGEGQARLEDIIQATDAHNLNHKLEVAADALRLPPWDADGQHLSGGEKRRVALCRLLLSNPDMLLLDEPTNHLDAESVAWLERFLHDFPGTVVAITHDRYFLDNAAGWILELDRGRGIPYEGNYSELAGRQKSSAWSRKTRRKPRTRKRSRRSWSGCAAIPKAARPRARRVCSASRNCSRRNSRAATRRTKSTSRRGRAWATSD